MPEKEFDVENFTAEDIEVVEEEIEDFDLEETPETYEIWLLGNDEDDGVLDFDVLIDDGYDTLIEARKCFNYFLDSKALKEFFEIKQISIPEEIKKLYLRLEAVIEEEPDMVCCTDVIEEVCFDANSIR